MNYFPRSRSFNRQLDNAFKLGDERGSQGGTLFLIEMNGIQILSFRTREKL